MQTVQLFIGGLATWRVTRIFNKESGPARLFDRLRWMIKKSTKVRDDTKKGTFIQGLTCPYCASVWFGFFFAGLYCLIGEIKMLEVIPTTFAFSALAIMAMYWVRNEKMGAEVNEQKLPIEQREA